MPSHGGCCNKLANRWLNLALKLEMRLIPVIWCNRPVGLAVLPKASSCLVPTFQQNGIYGFGLMVFGGMRIAALLPTVLAHDPKGNLKMINLVTVCTDTYPLVYAEKLHKSFARVSTLEVHHHCITDRPNEVTGWAHPIAPFKKSAGWWNKLNLFSKEMPSGPILYMDLDIVILSNFDEEISAMLQQNGKICCVSDAISWMGVKFSSSLMLFESGSLNHIFDRFTEEEADINERAGGDQVWTGPQLKDVYYVDEKFPNLKKNLKFHLASRDGNNLTLPLKVSEDVKLVDCGGRPKPHELGMIPYIKANWHDIPTQLAVS